MTIRLLSAALLLIPATTFAQRASSPADATVFIRMVGSVHAVIEEFGVKRSLDLDHVEIGTGSGFVISPNGYVITNDHVVNDTETIRITRIKGLQEATLTFKISRIDVCFQQEAVQVHGLIAPCVVASVAASDPRLDLAVLFISGSGLPYVALGDSDVVATGLQVDAVGYPLGRDVEVGRTAIGPDLIPSVSTTPGSVSALRANDAGERRFLQITNSVNPGNSGGPLVDRDGFAVGVIRMRLTGATNIAFAIPINDAKDFLESHGLDQMLPSRRIRLGPLQNLEAKGVGLRLPETLVDTSPFQSHIETATDPPGIVLRIDRVLSPWSPRQIEATLISGQPFEPISMTAREVPAFPRGSNSTLLFGSATDGQAGQSTRMDYAVLDLGPEKIVARYVGSFEQIAFNASVLRESLFSLNAQRFGLDDRLAVEKLEWSTLNGRTIVALPAGWSVEPERPSPCSGVPEPAGFVAALPLHDLTLILRAAVWTDSEIRPDTAAQACSPQRGSLEGASYALRGAWLGTSYVVEGAFVRVGSRVVQLEILATEPRATLARALLVEWAKKASE
jgi:S1-C subfamily serine protease